MKAYIGAKIIKAAPMDRLTFLDEQDQPTMHCVNKPGYKVIYPDGYVSWSPKEVFETAYREITRGEYDLMNP